MKSHWKFVFFSAALFVHLTISGCGEVEEFYDPDTKEFILALYPETTNGRLEKIIRGPRNDRDLWHGKVTEQYCSDGNSIHNCVRESYVVCDYVDGKRHGVCEYYDKNDNKISITNYCSDYPCSSAKNTSRHNQLADSQSYSDSIYNEIESYKPWLNFWMMEDFRYPDWSLEQIKLFYNEIELYIATMAPANQNEFEDIFRKAVYYAQKTSRMERMYSLVNQTESYNAAKESPLRWAFQDHYRGGMTTPTYDILKNSYPDYLLRLKIYGAAATDVQRYTDEIDARLKTLDPLDPNDPMFTIHLDKYLEDEYIDVQLNYTRLSYSTEIAATIVALQSDAKTIQKTVNPLRQAAMRVYFDESAVVALSAVYVAFFERAADADGLAYWTAQAGSGAVDFDLLRQLTNGFAQHPSYTSIYGGLSDSAFVDAIYLNIGGAPADADGKAYWLTQLDDGMTRPDFIAQFILDLLSYREATLYQLVIDGILTPEERDNALLRKNRLTNKAVVGLTFTNTLGNASNLRPETDPLDPASLAKDPAYRASVKIIADVTEEIATREVALDYLATQPTIEMINDR